LGTAPGSVIESYLEDAEDEKFQILEDLSVKHADVESKPDGSLFSRIKEEDHVYIEWKSKLEVIIKEQSQTCRGPSSS